MHPSESIFVAGHNGLVGSALLRSLGQAGYPNLLFRSHSELDLEDADVVREFFSRHPPRHVFLAAARVGGILANQREPAEFIRRNLRIQTNVIHECWRSGVERLLFLGSSCIYPRLAPQPVGEESLMSGPLESTNRAYAVAKIAGIEMCRAYNRQYGTRFLAAMPANLYGPGDNYHPANSHLIPALIWKMHQAKIEGANEVVLWGSGTPRREFLHADDAAAACLALMNLPPDAFAELADGNPAAPLINLGSGEDMTVRELAELVAEVVGVKPRLAFDAARPDGTPRKLLDSSRLRALGWRPRIGLREGLQQTYADFCRRASGSAAGGPFKPVPCAS